MIAVRLISFQRDATIGFLSPLLLEISYCLENIL